MLVNEEVLARLYAISTEVTSKYQSRRHYKEMGEKHQFEFMGCGNTRVVYAINEDFVAKIALRTTCYSINKREKEKYDDVVLRDRNKELYTQILFCSKHGEFIIAERVIPCFGDNEEGRPKKPAGPYIPDFEWFKQLGIDHLEKLTDDPCIFNFGKRKNGEMVVLDYA